MRELNILGLKLKDYSLKESLRLTEQYLDDGALNTILYISTQNLIQITKDEKLAEQLEALDMTICQEINILEAAGLLNRNRQKEIENNDYLHELLRKLAREKRTVYLLTESMEINYELMAGLLRMQGNLNIVGMNSLEVSADEIINGINDKAPHVIISLFPCEKQLEFINNNKMMINGNLWIGLISVNVENLTPKKSAKLFKHYYEKMLKRKINKYNHEKTE